MACFRASGDEKWLDFESILITGFADGLDWSCERKYSVMTPFGEVLVYREQSNGAMTEGGTVFFSFGWGFFWRQRLQPVCVHVSACGVIVSVHPECSDTCYWKTSVRDRVDQKETCPELWNLFSVLCTPSSPECLQAGGHCWE